MFWRHFYCLGAGKLVAHIFLCCILYFCIWFCVYVYLYLCIESLQPARRSLYKCSCAGHRDLGVRWRLPWLHLQNMRFTQCPKIFNDRINGKFPCFINTFDTRHYKYEPCCSCQARVLWAKAPFFRPPGNKLIEAKPFPNDSVTYFFWDTLYNITPGLTSSFFAWENILS